MRRLGKMLSGGRGNELVMFSLGVTVGLSIAVAFAFTTFWKDIFSLSTNNAYSTQSQQLQSISSGKCSKPQVYNFMKEFGNREGHLDVPKLLQVESLGGRGKVVVDIGLYDAKEFFAAVESGYSVYGFEANPVTAEKLRKRCEEYDGNSKGPVRCVYVYAADILEPINPSPFVSYLIEGGAGSTKTALNMSLSGPGSSFVEIAPGVPNPEFKMVTVLPVSDVINTDIFLFKLDVQGFEFDVLKGAKQLFNDKIVKTLIMEVYPRGLGNAGIDFDEFLGFIWHDLGMFCSSSNPPTQKQSFPIDHPNSLVEFGKYLKGQTNATWWGQFDDFTCFNRLKTWISY